MYNKDDSLVQNKTLGNIEKFYFFYGSQGTFFFIFILLWHFAGQIWNLCNIWWWNSKNFLSLIYWPDRRAMFNKTRSLNFQKPSMLFSWIKMKLAWISSYQRTFSAWILRALCMLCAGVVVIVQKEIVNEQVYRCLQMNSFDLNVYN